MQCGMIEVPRAHDHQDNPFKNVEEAGTKEEEEIEEDPSNEDLVPFLVTLKL